MTPSSAPPKVTPSVAPPSMDERVSVTMAWRKSGTRARVFLVAWCLLLIVPAAIMYRVLVDQQRLNVQQTIERHEARMSGAEPSQTIAERSPPPGHEADVPAIVKVGMYVDRIPEFSVVTSTWKADFYLWFLWDHEGLNPGETFQIVNGETVSRTLLRKSENGKEHYALYRVTAEITKSFDVARFPRDEHMLTISIEDQAAQSYQLRYVSDRGSSDISSRVTVPGYRISDVLTAVKPHSYKTSMGDPALPADYKATYSEFLMGISIERSSWGLFLKMFVALYISVALALAGLLLDSAGERLALGGTALFVAIMNAESIATLTPDTGTSTLGDVVGSVGYLTIGVLIVQAIISHKYFSRENANRHVGYLFDWATLVLLTTLFVGTNVGVLSAATSDATAHLALTSAKARATHAAPPAGETAK